MQAFAVFDIDGTLIRWQLYHTLVDRLAKSGLLGKNTLATLKGARMRWKRRVNDEEFRAYEAVLVQSFEDALPNIESRDFDALVGEVIAEYKDQVYTYTRDLVQELKTKGYFLIAISGSHEELVAQIAVHYQFDAWAGSQYEREGNTFTGKKMVASHNKKELLEQFITVHNLTRKGSIAVGDSPSDIPMLERVENPIAFNPDKTLFAAAQQHGWKVVVERKNMIYSLEQKNGTYILA